MALDFGYWSALTGPIKTAGERQSNRDALNLQAVQLMQQQQKIQLNQAKQDQEYQNQQDIAVQSAMDDIYTKNQYKRQKDLDDAKNWHRDFSGWSDIQNVLREYGSIERAQIHGNLNELTSLYKHRVKYPHQDPNKGNPILYRVQENKKHLTEYAKYALKSEDAHLLTKSAQQKYIDWKAGKTDFFTFNGPRRDYLDEDFKQKVGVGENITLDKIIAHRGGAIIADIMNDKDLSVEEASNLSNDHIKAWLKDNIGWQSVGGVEHIGGKAVYGEKPINTEFSTEVIAALDGVVGSTKMTTVDDYLRYKKNGVSFSELFNDASYIDFDRIGGVDPSSGTHSSLPRITEEGVRIGKGFQIVGGPRVFADHYGIEKAITESIAGSFTVPTKQGDKVMSRYNSKNRTLYNVKTEGLYNERGHQITSNDIASTYWGGKDTWQESEEMDLELTGYHVVPKVSGKDANGTPISFLLANTTDDSDDEKIRKQYSGREIQYVLAAQLRDPDLVTLDDYYYKEVELNATLQSKINEALSVEGRNKAKTQMIEYDQKQKFDAIEVKRKVANKVKLANKITAGDVGNFDRLADAYDKEMGIGLRMAGVSTNRVQTALPFLMSELYVNSQKERTYPHTFPDGTQVATPGAYMAISSKKLNAALSQGKANLFLEAINGGPAKYKEYLEQNYSSADVKRMLRDAKLWSKYYN